MICDSFIKNAYFSMIFVPFVVKSKLKKQTQF